MKIGLEETPIGVNKKNDQDEQPHRVSIAGIIAQSKGRKILLDRIINFGIIIP